MLKQRKELLKNQTFSFIKRKTNNKLNKYEIILLNPTTNTYLPRISLSNYKN